MKPFRNETLVVLHLPIPVIDSELRFARASPQVQTPTPGRVPRCGTMYYEVMPQNPFMLCLVVVIRSTTMVFELTDL